MSLANTSSNNDFSLIERGFNYLSVDEFEKAVTYFDRALDINAHNYQAYFGLLLAERQCKCIDAKDLIELGFCIDQDNNYKFALQYADDNQKQELTSIAKKSTFMCHVKIVELISQHKFRPAFLRAVKYSTSKFADAQLVYAHSALLRDCNPSETTRETPKALLLLLKIYEGDVSLSEIDETIHLSSTVKKMYVNYMNRVLDELSKKIILVINGPDKTNEIITPISVATQRIRQFGWFQPIYTRGKASTYFGFGGVKSLPAPNYEKKLDKKISAITELKSDVEYWKSLYRDIIAHLSESDRKTKISADWWLVIVEYLADTLNEGSCQEVYVEYMDLLFSFFDYAESCAVGTERDIYKSAKKIFAEDRAKKDDSSFIDASFRKIKYLITKYPSDYLLYWRCVELYMASDFSKKCVDCDVRSYQASVIDKFVWYNVIASDPCYEPKDISAHDCCYSFVKKSTIEEAVSTFRCDIEVLDQIPKEKAQKAEPYLSKAIELAGGKSIELKEKWEQYINDLRQECKKTSEMLNVTIDAIEDFEKKINRREKGLCIHCGGKFRLLNKKCSVCGKPKDY